MEVRWLRTMSRGNQIKIPAEHTTVTNAESYTPWLKLHWTNSGELVSANMIPMSLKKKNGMVQDGCLVF